MRRVVSELVKGFKEIVLVAVLLSLMIFIFANYGVHLFGLRFAACNDHTVGAIRDSHLAGGCTIAHIATVV